MKLPVCLLLLISVTTKAIAQKENIIAGTWKGSSICQVKNSPCHDETVVYRISSSGNNRYKNTASKIVNGKEEEMGDIDFTYDPSTKLLTSVDQQRNARWEFKITGKKMDGTLYSQGKLYRIVKVEKQD